MTKGPELGDVIVNVITVQYKYFKYLKALIIYNVLT